MSLTDEIERLKALRDSGALTEDEFTAAKAQAFERAAATDTAKQEERAAQARRADNRETLVTEAASGLFTGFGTVTGWVIGIIATLGAVGAGALVFDQIALIAGIAVLAIIGFVWLMSMTQG